MGGNVTTFPVDPNNPTVVEYNAFMTTLANAGPNTTVLMTFMNTTVEGDPPELQIPATWSIPVAWVKIEPRFVIQPPVVTPPVVDPPPVPPPSPVIMYVVAPDGLNTRNASIVDPKTYVGHLVKGSQVKFNPDTVTINGYVWRIIAAGEPAAGLYAAEKKADGSEVYLSVNRPL